MLNVFINKYLKVLVFLILCEVSFSVTAQQGKDGVVISPGTEIKNKPSYSTILEMKARDEDNEQSPKGFLPPKTKLDSDLRNKLDEIYGEYDEDGLTFYAEGTNDTEDGFYFYSEEGEGFYKLQTTGPDNDRIKVPDGGIIMYAGDVSENSFTSDGKGIGAMKNWYICNGNNGTPDLSDKFVVCQDFNEITEEKEDNKVGHYTTPDEFNAFSIKQENVPPHAHQLKGLEFTLFHTHDIAFEVEDNYQHPIDAQYDGYLWDKNNMSVSQEPKDGVINPESNMSFNYGGMQAESGEVEKESLKAEVTDNGKDWFEESSSAGRKIDKGPKNQVVIFIMRNDRLEEYDPKEVCGN